MTARATEDVQTALYRLDVSYDSCTTGEDVVSVNREVWVSGLKQLNCRTENKLKNENPACWDVMPCSLVYVYRRFRGACQWAQWLYSTRVLFLRSAVAVQTFRAFCTWPQHGDWKRTKCGKCLQHLPVTADTELRSNFENVPAVFMETYITILINFVKNELKLATLWSRLRIVFL